ncbi:MAG: YggS family pyridoxal phosphate-dependent enzyme [Clostridiales bacterium]|nr:YggS family pyridoxal phosphate-dependent enzyme [Clostridiales bacterium]
MDISENLAMLRQQIENASLASGRNPDDVTLIGVSKTIDSARINQSLAYGLKDFGENRVQELLDKYDQVENVRWHMIGQLQRNKVKYIVNKVSMIHSLDRLSLAREINRQADKINRVVPVLVQVNPANEESKSGLPYDEVIPFIETIYNLKNIKVMGLMLIAPMVEDNETIRPYFTMMKQLFDGIKQDNYPHIEMKHLSMGMSNDFETAIEEGSTMVRIGTAIFGKR